jgi:hypothetical protein
MKNYKTYFTLRKSFFISILCIITINGFSQIDLKNFNHDISIKPDYHNLYYWASHPYKIDNADSIPFDLIKQTIIDSSVDVFFIHPTTFLNDNFYNYNADINDTVLNKKTDETTILFQASVFNQSCRIFSPRYRQAHINCFYIDEEKSTAYFDTAYNDIKRAFEHYIVNFNHNRPIIIASHSQGTKHAGRLLKEFFEDKPLYKQLVCAYIIGMPVPENYFNKIPPCKDSTETGCFVAWRTFKKGYYPEFVKNEKFKSVVTNPLSWTLDQKFVSKKFNKGGVLRSFNKVNKNVASAQIKGNILWSCKPDIFGKIFITKKNYHIADINLFYVNIRENVKQRINNFNK